jgi:predicted cobalt transporter CbtA
MLQTLVHYTLHLLAPGLIAYVFFRSQWRKAWLIMLATMLVDLDHLLATPIFDPGRCSINFHPLHTYWAMAGYVVLLFFKKTRIIAVGLLFHMFTDYIDCQWN